MVDSKKNDQASAEETTDSLQARKADNSGGENVASGQNGGKQGDVSGIDFLLDVPLQVSVEVGRARMLIKDFLQMKEGGVIELDKMADEPLDLYVNSRLIARGEAVVVNEKFGLRLIDVVSTSERLEKLR